MGFRFALVVLLLSQLHVAVQAGQKARLKNWTFLYYVAGDEQEIDPWSRVSLRRLEQIGSDENRWIVAHADFALDETGKQIVSEPAKRYEIHKFPGKVDGHDFSTLGIRSPVMWQSAGETNSGGPESLRDFLSWGMAKYPARHYAVFLLGHSWGWRGFGQDFNPGFALPKSPGGSDVKYVMMSLSEMSGAIRQALPTGDKLDLLGMDACNDGVIELAYEMRELARTLVVTSTEMPFMGLDYDATLSRPIRRARELARRLVADTVPSFGRGGTSIAQEGNYPTLSLMALDLEKMGPLFTEWKSLTAALANTNFKAQFLGDNYPLWQDGSGYVDIAELTAELVRNGATADVRDRAARVLGILGVRPAPDDVFLGVSTAGADRIRVTFQGDENGAEDERLKEARESFHYLNPHLKKAVETWTAKTASPAARTTTVEFPWTSPSISIRPFIQGAQWASVEGMKGGQVISVARAETSRSWYLQTEFPRWSPYLITGHTHGAARNHGLAIHLDAVLDQTQNENHHLLPNNQWLSGQDYYRSISFSRDIGWAGLLFGPALH